MERGEGRYRREEKRREERRRGKERKGEEKRRERRGGEGEGSNVDISDTWEEEVARRKKMSWTGAAVGCR